MLHQVLVYALEPLDISLFRQRRAGQSFEESQGKVQVAAA
jgi:hypothetical protein